ncbi:MAG: deoxyguanosinetriphosphate triphosphohydrolase [Candidatus Aminicenantes bacterium]|nr:deoxyguanosinetriphosphate triphosphohydrolase [Candidatus Aminicenantes bacterium]
MRNIRLELESRENAILNERAARSSRSSRQRPEKPSPVRTEFQRDRDRILHSKAFRRLKHKTQVFIAPEGDHFRTRLTHTLELSQIARTIARALNLNEDLTEAIALGHDLGHTPFGHIGEAVLDKLSPGGFRHYEQSLRVVDKLEENGAGLNLTAEVRDGIVKHSKGQGDVIPRDRGQLPSTLEGQIVRLSDMITYVNHDIDDAKRAGIISDNDIPESSRRLLGTKYAKRIDTIVIDVIEESLKNELEIIVSSPPVFAELLCLRAFLFKNVYSREERLVEKKKIREILLAIHAHVGRDPQAYINPFPEEDPLALRIIDFIAGMTDNYALDLFREITLPEYPLQKNVITFNPRKKFSGHD